jgi:hypothetical protein
MSLIITMSTSSSSCVPKSIKFYGVSHKSQSILLHVEHDSQCPRHNNDDIMTCWQDTCGTSRDIIQWAQYHEGASKFKVTKKTHEIIEHVYGEIIHTIILARRICDVENILIDKLPDRAIELILADLSDINNWGVLDKNTITVYEAAEKIRNAEWEDLCEYSAAREAEAKTRYGDDDDIAYSATRVDEIKIRYDDDI